MSLCDGDGKCLKQCCCNCYDEEICDCSHRQHNGYCPSDCCMPVECKNYKYCGVKQPKWISDCHNNMCINCVVQMGKHIVTKQIKKCCVCLEKSIMLKLECGHHICGECWYKITKEGLGTNECNSQYLLCRKLNN